MASDGLTFDRELIVKYNRPGPRYTSYPTALQFTPQADTAALLADVAAGTGPLSLYVHLPFCESLCWFCACTTVITKSRTRADRYLDALEREMDLFAPHLQPGRLVEQLHFGGGSPSFLEPAQLRRLIAALRARFAFAPDAECSVEVDPRTLTEEKVAVLAEGGFQRASFGVQDVDAGVQEAVHRHQPPEMNRRVLGWLRAAGFTSLNVDLIYGLPRQSVASFRETLEEVLSYDPDRLAVFSYAHVPWVAPAQKILEQRETLPPPELKLTLLELIVERLTEAGYAYIGMDHFAKPDDELARAQQEGTLHRNFQGYSTRAGRELCAFGMSAISQSTRAYRQNLKDVEAYEAALAANRLPLERGYQLTPDDLLRRSLIMRLMCDLRLDYAALSASSGVDVATYFAAEIASLEGMEADGLLRRTEGGLQVLPPGRLLIRNIAMAFDAYLQPGLRRHAQTI